MPRGVSSFYTRLLILANLAAFVSGATTADHTQFPILNEPMESVHQVTAACLTCHTEAARQIQHTKHWTWNGKEGQRDYGKINVLNNFCIGVSGNEPRCTSCHVGYGWADETFDFSAEENVDCLVCHDQTGSYKKLPTGAGYPVSRDTNFKGVMYFRPDLNYIAKNIGLPTRENCGACHFEGGGGDAVKHGDLDGSLVEPSFNLDVHMASTGANFSCTDCHTTTEHIISGSRYNPIARDLSGLDLPRRDTTSVTCISCHGNEPHTSNAKLNDHTDDIACQTCHIPSIARERATKMWWDWSKAGELDENGKPFKRFDDKGQAIYDSQKGLFRWGLDIEPEYRWFNGDVKFLTLNDTLDTSGVVTINAIQGSPFDGKSKIWPFKVHRGKQPYDEGNRTLVIPKLYGSKGSGAYWADFDWAIAIRKGAAYNGQNYSGRYDFIETEMYWPINHMVAPAADALQCNECHSREGRLAHLAGCYLPGRDTIPWLDRIMWLALAAIGVGVMVHGMIRIYFMKMLDDK